MSEETKKIGDEIKILTVEEMKEKAFKIAKSIPNLEEKRKFMTEVRGFTIEFSPKFLDVHWERV